MLHKLDQLQEGKMFSLITLCYSFGCRGNIRQTFFFLSLGVIKYASKKVLG